MNEDDHFNFSNLSPLQSDDEFDGNDLLDYTEEILSTGSYCTDENDSKRIQFSLTTIPSYVELQSEHSTYVDCEIEGKIVAVTFNLEKDLGSNEFVAIKVECLPNCTFQNDFFSHVEQKRVKGRDFLDLSLRLVYMGPTGSQTGRLSDGFAQHSIPIKVNAFNGEYCITVVNRTERLLKGSYILWISAVPLDVKEAQFSTIQIQTLKINLRIEEEVDATSVMPNSRVSGTVLPGNTVFYRFMLGERNKLIRCSVNHLDNIKNTDTDEILDIFITNRFCGLFPVNRDTAIWTSDYQVNRIVEILPDDVNLSQDPDEGGSDAFIVAVSANPEYLHTENQILYELSIEIEDYQPVIQINSNHMMDTPDNNGQQSIESHTLTLNEYSYFSIEFDPTEQDSIAFSCNVLRPHVSRVPSLAEKYRNITDLRCQKMLSSEFLTGVSAEKHLFQDIVRKVQFVLGYLRI